ncbi:MAG: hypothetical protein MUC29_10000 [Pyrinomonadaceae bacterium]|jgi:hypothetical protein|nr:hypothetical protein [Pyrinomonadaceae bacterium]
MKRKTDLFTNVEKVDELTQEELSLLYLIPLVQTAWACGAVSPREKQVIYQSARTEQIDEKHQFNDIIHEWLLYQPSKSFFDNCLFLINDSLEKMTVKERQALKTKILQRCNEVAASAGGKSLMDINHHISDEEKHLLNRLKEFLY